VEIEMESGLKRFSAVVFLFAVCNALFAFGQDYNPRAVEDLKAFMAKFEEGDTLFNQKKYAEAATVLAASHELFQRAERRQGDATRTEFSIKPGQFPALRYYGYGFGSNASLSETPTGGVKGSAGGLHMAATSMWMDAAILSGADKIPLAGTFNDPPMVDMSEEQLDRLVSDLYGPVSRFKLPVPDDEWRDVVLWSRRAQLIVEYALQKYTEWKTGTRQWGSFGGSFQHTGNEFLGDIKAKLAEAEPEYAKIVSDAKSAAPRGVKDWIGYKIEDLDKAIAGAKKEGWVLWTLARDLYITKDYVSDIRKSVGKMYAQEGKDMPGDALKPLEDKVAELKSVMEKGAAKWKFPAGKTHNATIEAKAAASVKSRFSGATILKTALDSSEWIITKNDLGIPRYRSLGVLVLTKIPGQSHPWLVFGYFRQTYTGGGTYSSGGTFEAPSDIRMQAG
jgi:hypothetical protein